MSRGPGRVQKLIVDDQRRRLALGRDATFSWNDLDAYPTQDFETYRTSVSRARSALHRAGQLERTYARTAAGHEPARRRPLFRLRCSTHQDPTRHLAVRSGAPGDDLQGLTLAHWQTVQQSDDRITFEVDERRCRFHIENLNKVAWHLWGYDDWAHAYTDHLLHSGELARIHRLTDGTFISATSPAFAACTHSPADQPT